jgi:pyridinium-3,5-bisthiocarboxylic acid mononucleotide nickel chelatase
VARTLYFDCFSGVSGDMVLGALLDLGLPFDALRGALGSLAIEYGGISSARVTRAGVSATKFTAEAEAAPVGADVGHPGHGHHHHHEQAHEHAHAHHHHDHDAAGGALHQHRSLKEIAALVGRSALSPAGKDRALHLFERLGDAEAAIHGVPLERVHLHEVGALDSIIDIVGAVYGLEWVGASEVRSSPLAVGSGTVECAHGTFPVPAPATARLLKDVPVYAGAVAAEMVTPTGALIVTDYASGYGGLPELRIERIGYGAGTRDFPKHPNVLRLFLGESGGGPSLERIVSIECEIDDMNPQLFGPLMDRLAAAGALDVFYASVQMKKNRPGTLVTVLALPERREAVVATLFEDTTTIGVRFQEVLRERLDREIVTVETPVGPIRFKVARRNGRVLNAAPEFDDCAGAAASRGLAIKDVQAVAIKAWLDRGR